jgi:hypothetical protein
MDALNTAFFEEEDILITCCVECDSEHMEHPFDTSFCSHKCYTSFFEFINQNYYDNEPVERQVFANVNDDYDANEDFEYDDDDNLSCASDETYLSIYTYVRIGRKSRIRQLKNRILVKVSEKYGSAYDTGTI